MRENRTQGSVQGTPGNRRSYCDDVKIMKKHNTVKICLVIVLLGFVQGCRTTPASICTANKITTIETGRIALKEKVTDPAIYSDRWKYKIIVGRQDLNKQLDKRQHSLSGKGLDTGYFNIVRQRLQLYQAEFPVEIKRLSPSRKGLKGKALREVFMVGYELKTAITELLFSGNAAVYDPAGQSLKEVSFNRYRGEDKVGKVKGIKILSNNGGTVWDDCLIDPKRI